ncbi:hypothetical protein AAVH_08065 [Aphelenchoides avenae]|nr:hypothetical protein AAVH_08065 [Aphelenchus avenae]
MAPELVDDAKRFDADAQQMVPTQTAAEEMDGVETDEQRKQREALQTAAEIIAMTKQRSYSGADEENHQEDHPTEVAHEKEKERLTDAEKKRFADWMDANGNNMYPTRPEKEALARHLNVTFNQLTRLLANHRRRTQKYKRMKSARSSPHGAVDSEHHMEDEDVSHDGERVDPHLHDTLRIRTDCAPHEMSSAAHDSGFSDYSGAEMADHSPNSSNSALDPLNHLLSHARIAAEADADRQRRIDETICEVREKVSRGEWSPLPMDYTDRDAHGFATPPPSVLPRSADGSTHNNSGIPPSFFTPPSHHDQRHNAAPHGISNAASFASLFGCQPVPQVDAQRLHSPALTPPESAADHAVRQNPLEAQLEAPKLQQASGHDAESNAQAAATTAVVQQMLQAAMAGQMGAGGASSSSSGFSAAVALAQLLNPQNPSAAAAVASNPVMLFAAQAALGGQGLPWSSQPEALPTLLALLQQSNPQQAALHAKLLQDAYQHKQMQAMMQHLQQQAVLAAQFQAQAQQLTSACTTPGPAQRNFFSPNPSAPAQQPQWMSPPLSANTPASSSSPLFHEDNAEARREEQRCTSTAFHSSAVSPQPRGDLVSAQQSSKYEERMDYEDFDEFGRAIAAEHRGLTEQEGIAVAVLAGLASSRRN